jgi:uncharacterized repeat protein (TIGR03803 family)
MSRADVSRLAVASIFCVALVLPVIPAQAQTYSVLYDAPGSPGIQNPDAQAIAQGRDGNLYTTSIYGGTDYGTLFKFTPSGTATIVNDTTVGYFVASGVTLGTDGNFYGTDQDGGPSGGGCGFSGCGQVYKVTPAGVETVLYNFTNSATDGYDPQSAPIEATNGKFYGTTPYSAGNYISVAYSVTSTGTFSTVHTFTNAEGQNVFAGLVQGTNGNFYGVAQTQGANGFGSIFKMTPTGTVTVLHSFDSTDGANPSYPLIQASDGNFYGVASGGIGSGAGVIFKITSAGTYTPLYDNFNYATDGSAPSSSLVQATNGKLYGVTSAGGASSGGTIYSITTKGTFAVLYSFDGTNVINGFNPASPLTQNTNGVLYGTTYEGGTSTDCNIYGCGVVYSLDIGAKPFARLAATSGIEGTSIGIFGQGFSTATDVTFGGVSASFTTAGNNYLTATVPADALTGSVVVEIPGGNLTSNTTFKVTPTQTTFSPPSGPVGTPVVITGTGLTQTTLVKFGTVKATNFTVNSDTQVTADVPTGAITATIHITTKGGATVSKTKFTVN